MDINFSFPEDTRPAIYSAMKYWGKKPHNIWHEYIKKPIRDQYLIVKNGQLAGMGAHSYSKGSATGGSEEAVKYKKK